MREYDVPEESLKIDPRDFSIKNRLKPEYVLKVNNIPNRQKQEKNKKTAPKKKTKINVVSKPATKEVTKKSTATKKSTTKKVSKNSTTSRTSSTKKVSQKRNPNPTNLPAIRKKKKSIGKKIVLNLLFFIFVFIIAVVAGYNAVFYLFTI